MKPQNTLGCTETNQVLYSKIGIPSHLPISSQITFVCVGVCAHQACEFCCCVKFLWISHVFVKQSLGKKCCEPQGSLRYSSSEKTQQCIQYLRLYTYPPANFSCFHCFKQRMDAFKVLCFCHFSQAIEAKNVAFPTNYGYPSLGWDNISKCTEGAGER